MYIEIVINSVLIMSVLIICVRTCGLKSFSKMTSFDFAMTIAIGSILGSTVVSKSVKLSYGALAVVLLFTLQYLISNLRTRFKIFNELINNEPTLLFKDGDFLEKNLKICDLRKEDVVAKMREANALDFSKIHAVVFESTGDISVLHGESKVDDRLYQGVQS